MYSIKCLLGLTSCGVDSLGQLIDTSQISGQLAPWYAIVGLGLLSIYVTQLTDGSDLRRYIVKQKRIHNAIYGSLLLSLICSVIGGITPFIFPSIPPIGVVSYPAFWELVSIFSATITVIVTTIVLWKMEKFFPAFEKDWELARRISADAVSGVGSKQSIRALCSILLRNDNLKKLLFLCDRNDKSSENNDNHAKMIVSESLTHPTFLHEVCRAHPYLIITALLESDSIAANRTHIPVLSQFVNKLFWALIYDKESVLHSSPDRCEDTSLRSVMGVLKKSAALHKTCNPLARVGGGDLSEKSLKVLIALLISSISHYFSLNDEELALILVRDLLPIIEKQRGFNSVRDATGKDSVIDGLVRFDLKCVAEQLEQTSFGDKIYDVLAKTLFKYLIKTNWGQGEPAISPLFTAIDFWFLYPDKKIDKLNQTLVRVFREQLLLLEGGPRFPYLIRLFLRIYYDLKLGGKNENASKKFIETLLNEHLAKKIINNVDQYRQDYLPESWRIEGSAIYGASNQLIISIK